jgi:hypothetical protein
LRRAGARLKGKKAEIGDCAAARPRAVSKGAMNFPHFLRIEREQRGGSRHFVVHTHEPKLSLELAPDTAAPDKIGRGVIKRVCVPNSWAGDYGKYSKLISAAQEFFHESFATPAPDPLTPRRRR